MLYDNHEKKKIIGSTWLILERGCETQYSRKKNFIVYLMGLTKALYTISSNPTELNQENMPHVAIFPNAQMNFFVAFVTCVLALYSNITCRVLCQCKVFFLLNDITQTY